MKNVLILILAAFAISACSSGGSSSGGSTSSSGTTSSSSGTTTSSSSSSSSTSSSSTSSSSTSSSSSSGVPAKPDPVNVWLKGEKTVSGSTMDELLDNFQKVIFPVDEFQALLDQAETAGMDTDAADDIQDAVMEAFTAIGMTFGTDVSGGQVELINDTDVVVDSTLDQGSQGKGKSYQYVIGQDIDGVAVEIDLTFKFPGSGAQFTPEPGAMLVTLNPMEVNIETFSASAGDVTLTLEKDNPIATLSLGAYLVEDSDGDYVSAELWSLDDSPLLEADIVGWLRDAASGVDLKLVIDGKLTELTGDLYLTDSGDDSSVTVTGDDFLVSLEAEGIVGSGSSSSSSSSSSSTSSTSSSSSSSSSTTSSTSSSSSSTTSSTSSSSSSSSSTSSSTSSSSSSSTSSTSTSSSSSSSTSSSSGGTDSVEIELDGPGKFEGATLDDLVEDLMNVVDPDQVDALFNTAKAEGMDTASVNKIFNTLMDAVTGIGMVYGGDISGGQIELENNSGFDVEKTLDSGSKGKGKGYQYKVDQEVDGVTVDIDITFRFPEDGAQFAPEPGAMLVTINPMELHVDTFRAGTNGVWLELESTNPVMMAEIGAYLIEKTPGEGDYISAEVWADDDQAGVETDMHATITDGDYSITFDLIGGLPTLTGDIYIDDSEASVIDYDANGLEATMHFLK